MAGLDDLSSLFGGAQPDAAPVGAPNANLPAQPPAIPQRPAEFGPSAIAPAASPAAGASSLADGSGGFGNILARLKGQTNNNARSDFANSPAAASIAALPNVAGQSKSAAFFSGLAAGQKAQNDRANSQAASALAQQKMNMELLKQQFDVKHQQNQDAQAATNNKTLQEYYKGLIAAKAGGGADNSNLGTALSQANALHQLRVDAGYFPNDPAWQKKSDDQKAASAGQFFAEYPKIFGHPYPVGADGKPLPLPDVAPPKKSAPAPGGAPAPTPGAPTPPAPDAPAPADNPGAAPLPPPRPADLAAAPPVGSPPGTPPSANPAAVPPGGIQEGQTATNPQTGDKMIFQGGAWAPVPAPEGDE